MEAANAGCENEGRSPRASLEAGKDKSPKTSLLLYLVLSRVQLFCDPLGCNHPGSSVHGDSPGENSGVGCHALLQVKKMMLNSKGVKLRKTEQVIYHTLALSSNRA